MSEGKSIWPMVSIIAVLFLSGIGAAFTLGRMEQRGDDAAQSIADTKSATATLAAAQAISDKQTGERISRLEALERIRETSPMGKVIVVEQMSKRDRMLPTKIWRVAERQTNYRGIVSSGWRLVAKDLTLGTALQVLRTERKKQTKPMELIS